MGLVDLRTDKALLNGPAGCAHTLLVAAAENDTELIAAEAEGHHLLAGEVQQHLAQAFEVAVALAVAVSIIEVLEIVHIQHGQEKAHLLPLLLHALEHLPERLTVPYPRQLVGHGLLLVALTLPLQMDRRVVFLLFRQDHHRADPVKNQQQH